MIVDFHAHLWGKPADADLLAEQARLHGIDRVCLSSLASYVPDRREVAALNEATFAAAEGHPNFLLPFVYLNPMHGPDALAMLDEAHARGAVGIKLWVAVLADQRCVWPLAERAIELGLPVLQHAWHKQTGNLPHESDPVHVANLGRAFPDLKLVMAHLGGSWEWGIKAVREVPNVLADTSGTRIEMGMVEHAVAMLGAERVLFGSDALGCDYAITLAKIEAAEISDEAKRLILGGNARRLLGLPA